MDSIEYCKNKHFYEIKIQQSPCILCISCDPNSGKDQFQPTGVDWLSSLQQNIQMRGVEYCLGAMILSNGNYFCSIVLDPSPLGDLNIFMMELNEAIVIQSLFLLRVHSNQLWGVMTSVNFSTSDRNLNR